MLNKINYQDKYGFFTVLEKTNSIDPKVSIIMSAYNTPKEFLSKSIESVLNQTYDNFEFIIINDGANKLTSNILDSYAKKDNRIRLGIQNNMGLTKSLNRGILIARGKYIARQDTDDIWIKSKLEKQIKIISTKHSIILVGTLCKIVNKNFKNISENIDGYDERLKIKNTQEIKKALTYFNPFCHASILIDKNILQKIGCYNDNYTYSQDYELWIRVLKQYNAYILPNFLTIKIFHNESITGGSKRRKQRLFGLKSRYTAIKSFDNSIYRKSKLQLEYYIIYILPESLIVILKKIFRKNNNESN